MTVLCRSRVRDVGLLRWGVLGVVLCITGCASSPPACQGGDCGERFFSEPLDGPGHLHLVENVIEPVPHDLPRSRYGNPKVYEVHGQYYETWPSAEGYAEEGIASWYGSKFHGRLTSSREVYDMYQLTAAHRSLPIPTFVEVTNLENGKSIVVKVNDRGPFHENRIIDLSYAAAVKLDFMGAGTAPVHVRAINPAREQSPSALRLHTRAIEQSHREPPAVSPVMASAEEQRADPGLYFQLGAYADRENAVAMQGRVRDAIVGVVVKVLPPDTKPVYRVQLGPLYSTSLVTEIARELDRAGLGHYQIISK